MTGLLMTFFALALLAYAGITVSSAVQKRAAEPERSAPARERVFAVNVQRAELSTVTPLLEAFGEIQSRRRLELRMAVGGRVIWLDPAFVEGGEVDQDQEILRLDDADLRAALDRSEADLRDAEAEARDAARALELARDELEAAEEQAELRLRAFNRQKDLEARRVATAQKVEDAELAAASARQSALARRQALTQAEARLDLSATRIARARLTRDQAARDLADTELKAPFPGTLGDVGLVEGRLVQPGEQVAVLLDPDALEVAFRVSTAQYARLLDAEGALLPLSVTVRLEIGGADLTASGLLNRAGAAVGEGQSGRLLFARLDTARGFRPGDFVTVTVEEPPVDGVARLPASAFGADGAVLVVNQDDRLEALPVTLVRRQGNDVLVRGDGLAGRDVVLGRSPLLGAGIKVRPLAPATGDAPPAPDMVELTEDRRARLIAMVEANSRMPDAVKERVLTTLGNPKVPQRLLDRLEARGG